MAGAHKWVVHGASWQSTDCPDWAPPHRRIEYEDLVLIASAERGLPEGCAADRMQGSAKTAHEEWEALEADAALRHSDILLAYMQAAGVVPFHFGATFDTCQSMTSLLQANAQHYRACLKKVSGCAEFSIRASMLGRYQPDVATHSEAFPRSLWNGPRSTKSSGVNASQRCGEAFMGGLREAGATLQSMVDTVFPMARETCCAKDDGLSDLPKLDLVLLIPWRNVAAFTATVRAQIPVLASLSVDLQLSGPWPPYAFSADPQNDRMRNAGMRGGNV